MCCCGRMEHIPKKKTHYARVRTSNSCAIAYVVLSQKLWRSPGLHELDDRQSQTRRHGCHCWELQDEPFAFCGRIGTACMDLLNRAFSTHLIGFLLCTTNQERNSALKRLMYCVSQDTQGSVFCEWAKLHCSRWRRSSTLGWYALVTEVGTKALIHGLVKQTQFCVSFIAP